MRISVKQAAEGLEVTPQFIRIGIRNGSLPIGTAVKMSSVWTYYISAEAVERIKNAPSSAKDGAKGAEKGNYPILTQDGARSKWESS